MRRRWAAWLVSLALAAGCGASTSDSPIKSHLLRGVAEIRTTRDRAELHVKLVLTLASLRRDHASTAAERRARSLAIEGFEATLKGVRSQLDFVENDSGNVAAATRDARRADRYLARGASRLRAAGAALGIHIGRLS
jgi:Fic family protein